MRCQHVYTVVIFSHRFLDSDCINFKLLHSWLFIDLSEHHYTTQTSKFNNFFKSFLHDVKQCSLNPLNNYMAIWLRYWKIKDNIFLLWFLFVKGEKWWPNPQGDTHRPWWGDDIQRERHTNHARCHGKSMVCKKHSMNVSSSQKHANAYEQMPCLHEKSYASYLSIKMQLLH